MTKQKKTFKPEDVKGIQEESADPAAANEISTDPVVSGLDCTFTLTDEYTVEEVFGGKCVDLCTEGQPRNPD